jgi:co-chaperonin GroES (HSP10)
LLPKAEHNIKLGPSPEARKTFTPLGRKVAIYVYRVDKTEAGVLIPEVAQDTVRTLKAKVIACGPECKQVKEGDIVLVNEGTNMSSVNHCGHNLKLLMEEWIQGVVDLAAEADYQQMVRRQAPPRQA